MMQKGNDTEKLILSLNQLEEIPISGHFTQHVGIYDFSPKFRQWNVPNVKKTISEIEQDNSNHVYKQLFPALKQFTSKIIVTVCEPEFLPFNYVILSVIFDGKILESSDSYGQLRMSLLPIIKYCRLTYGLIPGDEIDFPMYCQFYYESKIVKPALIEVHNELEDLSNKKLNIEKYVETCDKLKQHFLLNGLDGRLNIISLIKIHNDFFILGNMGQLNSDFFNVFSVEPDSYQYPEINPFLPFFDSWPFPLLFVPYLLSVTFRVSISVYEDKLKKMLRQVNELKETYRKHEKPSGSDSLNSLLSLKHELNNLLSDFRQIKSVRKIFKSYFLTNSTICEKSIVVSFNDQTIDYDLVKDKIRVTYIHAINEGFVSLIKNVENHVREIKQDLKFIQERIEFLQQQRLQKNNSRSNRIMLALTFVIVIFTIVAGISVFDEWFNH